jgi:MFS family permease
MFGLAYGGIVPAYTLIVRELFPLREVGERLGFVYLFATIGMASGGLLGGYIFDFTESYRIAFAVGLLFNFGNLMMVIPLTRRYVRSMSQQPVPA